MSTKFFTNEAENTLINKIEGIFKHRNIHFFDALVEYFRASGHFRIKKFIEKAGIQTMIIIFKKKLTTTAFHFFSMIS